MMSLAKKAINANRSKMHKAPRTGEVKELKRMEATSVMGFEDGGFAIVSTDDLLPEILGYSDTKFDVNTKNENLKWWMEAMEAAGKHYVAKGIKRYAKTGGVRLGGIICNSRNVDHEHDLLRAFAEELGTKLLYFVPRNNIVQHAEIHKQTVIEYKPNSGQAQEYRNLAQAVIENDSFVIPTPMTQERLEEILMEYGFMETSDDYEI